jgi:hypothetical protein
VALNSGVPRRSKSSVIESAADDLARVLSTAALDRPISVINSPALL